MRASVETAVKVVHELQRYDTSTCRRRHSRGYFIRQMLFPHATRAQMKIAERVCDPRYYRKTRAIWVDLSDLRAIQKCLSPRRLVYQLRRHPLKKLPLVVLVPGGFVLWDGTHRATAAALLGKRRIRCNEIRRAPVK